MLRDLCSPSKLALRYSCPGSANLESNLKGTGELIVSEAAQQGTEKHEQISQLIRGKLSIDDSPDDVCTAFAATLSLLNDLRQTSAYIEINEYQVDLSDLGISGGSEGCRCDLIGVVPGYKAVLIDFKFGVGYVETPAYNWQMKAYAWAVWKAFGVSEVLAVIIQPNVDEEYMVKSDTFDSSDLEAIGPQIKDIVEKTKQPGAPLVRGSHCTQYFCHCKDVCPNWRDSYLSLPSHLTIAAHLLQISPEKRKELYENLLAAESWCSKAKVTMEQMAIDGKIEIDGYEIGSGRKMREWGKTDSEIDQELQNLAKEIGKEIELYKPAEKLSPSEVEKELGKSKKVKEALESLVIFKEGNPKLVKKKDQ